MTDGQFDAEKARASYNEIVGPEAAIDADAGKFTSFDKMKETITSSVEGMDDLIDKYGEIGQASETLIDANGEVGQEFGEMARQAVEAGDELSHAEDQLDEASKGVEEAGNKLPGISDSLGGLAGGMMQLTGAITMVSSAFNTLGDEGASGGQKAMAVLSLLIGVMTGVSAAQTILNNAKSLGVAITKKATAAEAAHSTIFSKLIVKLFAHSAAQAANTTATNVNTTATIANKLARLGLIGAAIALGAALVALTAILISEAS